MWLMSVDLPLIRDVVDASRLGASRVHEADEADEAREGPLRGADLHLLLAVVRSRVVGREVVPVCDLPQVVDPLPVSLRRGDDALSRLLQGAVEDPREFDAVPDVG